MIVPGVLAGSSRNSGSKADTAVSAQLLGLCRHRSQSPQAENQSPVLPPMRLPAAFSTSSDAVVGPVRVGAAALWPAARRDGDLGLARARTCCGGPGPRRSGGPVARPSDGRGLIQQPEPNRAASRTVSECSNQAPISIFECAI